MTRAVSAQAYPAQRSAMSTPTAKRRRADMAGKQAFNPMRRACVLSTWARDAATADAVLR